MSDEQVPDYLLPPMSRTGDSPILRPLGSAPVTDAATHVVTDQAKQNRSTANQWSLYGSHRQAIERLIVPAVHGNDRICIAGAGNCNDLDLPFLAEAYREVHLVDIDPTALQAAVDRQGLTGHARVHRHAPVDLTGIAEQVGRWAAHPRQAIDVDQPIRQLAAGPLLSVPGGLDCVLSPCVLTQLLSPARRALGDQHPRLPALRLAMRDGHLRSLARLLRPGGRLIVVIDLASSNTFEGMARVPAADLHDLMTNLVSRGKAYAGLDPASLLTAVRGSPLLRPILNDPVFTSPWHWHLSLQRSFLVYAATFTRTKTTL